MTKAKPYALTASDCRFLLETAKLPPNLRRSLEGHQDYLRRLLLPPEDLVRAVEKLARTPIWDDLQRPDYEEQVPTNAVPSGQWAQRMWCFESGKIVHRYSGYDGYCAVLNGDPEIYLWDGRKLRAKSEPDTWNYRERRDSASLISEELLADRKE